MAIIKKENKKFDYKPRYYQGDGNPYEFKHKFDQFRSTVGKNKSLKSKFNSAFDELKESGFQFNRTILIIVGILFLLFLVVIDFDLSIFLLKN